MLKLQRGLGHAGNQLQDSSYSAIDNTRVYYEIMTRLSMLAQNIFVWNNLPDTMNKRYIEKTLFYHGTLFAYKPEGLSTPVCAKASGSNNVNRYFEPSEYIVSDAMDTKTVPASQGVVLRCNYQGIPLCNIAQIYAKRLYELTVSANVNTKLQKFPTLITAPRSKAKTARDMYLKIDGNSPVVFEYDDNKDVEIKCVNTGTPYVADKLLDTYRDTLFEYLTILGVKTANVDKRERMITSEVDSNNEVLSLYTHCFDVGRQDFCRELNSKFNLQTTVERWEKVGSLYTDVKQPTVQ